MLLESACYEIPVEGLGNRIIVNGILKGLPVSEAYWEENSHEFK